MIVSQRISKHLFQLMGEYVFISMDELVGLEFEHYANLNAVEKGEIRFSYLKGKQEENKEKGYVYLWLEMNKDDVFRVVYVGKAGRTMRERCSQLRAAFTWYQQKPSSTPRMQPISRPE